MGATTMNLVTSQRPTARGSITIAMPSHTHRKASADLQQDSMTSFSTSTSSYDLSSSLSSSEGASVSILAAVKTVRFGEEDRQEVWRYPRAVGDNLYIDGKEQKERINSIRLEVRQYKSLGDELLEDIHALPVSERIERIARLHAQGGETRGLEKDLCFKFSDRARIQRKRTIRGVLDNQEALKRSDIPVDQHGKVIANASRESSHDARCMARILGLADQQYIRNAAKEQAETEEPSEGSTDAPLDESYSSRELGMSSSRSNSCHSKVCETIRRRHAVRPQANKSLSMVRRISRTVSKRIKRVGSSRVMRNKSDSEPSANAGHGIRRSLTN